MHEGVLIWFGPAALSTPIHPSRAPTPPVPPARHPSRPHPAAAPRSAALIALCQLFVTASLLRTFGVPAALATGPVVCLFGMAFIALRVRGG
jgi:hypothetical protein